MAVHEIVIISGKGGTGKTSLTASLIPWLDKPVVADCDVDAPDLHILTYPVQRSSEEFVGTKKAVLDGDKCIQCGKCVDLCRFGAISPSIEFSRMKCEGCGVCEYVCPAGAVKLEDAVVGTVYRGDTEFGPMVHARLIPGEETSGKLVSKVRSDAQAIATAEGFETVLIDGSPGVGCNVISSITGAAVVVVVTEPTKSGLHDMLRVFDITEKFSGKTYAVINKYDLSEEMSRRIEEEAEKRGVPVVLKVPFNRDMVKAITDKKIPSLAEKEFFERIGWEGFVSLLKKSGGSSS